MSKFDCPTIECVACHGHGQECDYCQNSGRIDILTCPIETIDNDIVETIKIAELYVEHGIPPVSGGLLDQTAEFVNAAHFIASEQNYWKRQKGILNV